MDLKDILSNIEDYILSKNQSKIAGLVSSLTFTSINGPSLLSATANETRQPESIPNDANIDPNIQIRHNGDLISPEQRLLLCTTLQAVDSLLNGRHISIVTETTADGLKIGQILSFLENLQASVSRSDGVLNESLTDYLIESSMNYIMTQDSEGSEAIACLQLLVLGVCYLELFMQMNYTGPELLQADIALFSRENLSSHILSQLECDGTYPFPNTDIPICLIIARSILSFLSQPKFKCWRHGIFLDPSGKILLKSNDSDMGQIMDGIITRNIKSCSWHSARASVVHLRCLQKQNYSHIPTLWKECQMNFNASFQEFDRDEYQDSDIIRPQLWVEWGLCYHFFEFGDKGKASFRKASEVAGLETALTGAMGKRTKYQQTDYAQLILVAKSKLSRNLSPRVSEEDKKPIRFMKEKKIEEGEKQEGGWQHAEWEMGKRLVGEVEGDNSGQEAAVREVMLDSMDGGAAENILYEGGPKYTEAIDAGSSELHPIDQIIILSLCLDVHNSNPMDGLTAEEMFPYIQRVLQLAQNWMIHSTGLLERSWLEFEKRRTFDRALLQIQALLDQHTTKLTITQSTYKAIEESAPAQDRLRYIFSIIYPAQYELKRDLAIKYLKSQVFMSALGLFRELEMWDEVVQCYQLMDKPQRAEMVVRERLRVSETPYMVTALADLTQNEELYETAWNISHGRFARAKRTLGRICYDRGEFQACINHLNQALAVQPMVATCWYLRGIAAMQLQNFEVGIESFVRCVQQDMEVGEAYANMGAIYMRQREYMKAYSSLQEALKIKHDSWKILENLMGVALALARWKDAIHYMDLLLQLRGKSQRPVHKEELRHLVTVAVAESETVSSNEQPKHVKSLKQVLEEFLLKITTSIHVDSEIWDILADFYEKQGLVRTALDCRFKEIRAANAVVSWEQNLEKVRQMLSISEKLVNYIATQKASELSIVTKSDVYGCKSMLQSVVKKIENEYYILAPPSQDYVGQVDQEYRTFQDLLAALDRM